MSAAARSVRPFGGPVLLVLLGLLLVVVDVGVSGGGESLPAWLAADFAPDVAGFALMALGAAGVARTGVRWAPLAVLAFLLAAAASLVALGGSPGLSVVAEVASAAGVVILLDRLRALARAQREEVVAARARRGRDATLAATLAALVLVVAPVDAVPPRPLLVLTLVALGVILALVVAGLAATTRLRRPGPADGRTFAGRWPEPGSGLAVGVALLVVAGLGAAVAHGVDWALTREAAPPSDPIDLSLLDGIPTPEGTGRAALTGVPGGGIEVVLTYPANSWSRLERIFQRSQEPLASPGSWRPTRGASLSGPDGARWCTSWRHPDGRRMRMDMRSEPRGAPIRAELTIWPRETAALACIWDR